jgi:uncharacterized membrane protein
MVQNVVRFLQLVILALLTGTMFGIWIGFNPMQLSATTYVEQQQNAIRSLNSLLPAMGLVCILLTAFLAVQSKYPRVRYILIGAAALLILAGIVTRFANQPINAIVLTWSAQSPPAEWAQLREQWWQWHIVRTVAAIGSLVLSLVAAISTRGAKMYEPSRAL